MGCAAVQSLFKEDMIVDIDHLFLTKITGSGGFATVYAGVHMDYQSWFAVKKVNKADLLKHKGGSDMIMSELEAWRRVGHHSYIVDLHFAFQDKHHCYFLMDLMAGADLRYYLKKKIILTEPELAFLVGCISSALRHIHSKGVLHRDVKPENIMFDHRGYPYLTDFGVAYMNLPPGDCTCRLSSGTKQYLAPEVFTESHAHDSAADFWALGIVMYEIMFGQRPYRKYVPPEYVKYLQSRADRRARLEPERDSPALSTSSLSSCPSPYLSSDNRPLVHRPQPKSPLTNGTSSCVCRYGASSVCSVHTSPTTGGPGATPPSTPRQLPPLSPRDKSALLSKAKGEKLKPSLSVMALLRRDEAARRTMPPGKASRYKVPVGVVYPLPSQRLDTGHPDATAMGTVTSDKIESVQERGPETDDVEDRRLPVCADREGVRADSSHLLLSNQVEAPRDSAQLTGATIDSVKLTVGSERLLCTKIEPALPPSLKIEIPFLSATGHPISTSLMSLFNGLLDIRPEYRLGGGDRYDKLVQHPWFSKVKLSWEKVEAKTATPAFVPRKSEIDQDLLAKHGSNIDSGSIDMFLGREAISRNTQEKFDNFHHIAKEYLDLFPDLRVHCEGKGSGVKTIRNKTVEDPKLKPSSMGVSRVIP